MEVAWRGPELSRPVFDMKKKQAWGVDAHKVLLLTMGQLQSDSTSPGSDEATLDLMGEAATSSRSNSDHNFNLTEFPELDPDQPRLPPGWKTCLDLKTGKLSFVNKTTGITSDSDPRKQPLNVAPLMALEPSSPSPRAHEFLGSKKSEILLEESLRTSSSSGGSPQMLSFSTGTQVWNLQLADTNVSLMNDICCTQLAEDRDQERSNLKLDLNLTASAGSPSRPREQEQSVCNMEMVQRALRLTDPAALECRKRELPIASGALPKLSVSPALSSLTSTRCDPAWSHGGSPSTSSSSSTSSRSRHLADHGNQVPVAGDSQTGRRQPTQYRATDAEVEAEPGAVRSKSTVTETKALVMGACTRCLMYIMLDKCDPKCPRCRSDTLLDITSAPHCPNVKRERVEQHDELDLMRT